MIPFAILSGKIKTKTDEKEIRLLELSPDYFTFRLLKEQARLEKELARSKGICTAVIRCRTARQHSAVLFSVSKKKLS